MSPPTAARRRAGPAAGLLLALGVGAGGGGPARAAEAAPASQPAGSPESLIRQMEAAQQDLRTLSADFVQTSRVKLFKQELRSEGRLVYERERSPASGAGAPGAPSTRLRWEYLRPDPSTLVLVGDKARLRMGTLPPQVFDTGRDPNLRAIFAQLRLWLGAGSFSEARGEYDMRVGGDGRRPALILAPRPGSVLGKTFARVELHLDGRSFELARLLLVETSGDEKEIAFTHVRRNAPLPNGAFDF